MGPPGRGEQTIGGADREVVSYPNGQPHPVGRRAVPHRSALVHSGTIPIAPVKRPAWIGAR